MFLSFKKNSVKYTKEIKTGLLAIFSIALFIFGYNYLKGSNLLESDRIFFAIYPDVEGLDMSSNVTIKGLKVGKVQNITISEDGNLIVRFNVKTDYPFSKNSVAKIYGGNIIGGKNIAIETEQTMTNLAESGDTLPGVVEEGLMELVNTELGPLRQKIEATFVSADSLLVSLNDLIDLESRQNLQQTFKNLNETTASLNYLSENLKKLLEQNQDNLNETFSNLETTTENFSKFSDTLSQLQLGRIAANLDNAVKGINDIVTRVERGEGSLGKLLEDETLVDNLEGASRELELLLRDIKLNPKRYIHISVFGKNPEPYTAPENEQN